MRDTYHEGLDSLSDRLVEMTRLARHAVARATTALLDSDLNAAQEVISGDELKAILGESHSSQGAPA